MGDGERPAEGSGEVARLVGLVDVGEVEGEIEGDSGVEGAIMPR